MAWRPSPRSNRWSSTAARSAFARFCAAAFATAALGGSAWAGPLTYGTAGANRVVGGQFFECGIREGDARFEVMLRAERVVGRRVREAELLRGHLQNLQALRHHFFPNAVARHDCEFHRARSVAEGQR